MTLAQVKGRLIPVQSQSYRIYEAKAAQYLVNKPEKPIDYPVEISCIYMMPLNKDGKKPKRKVDLCNLLAATHDILVHYGILADDNSSIIFSVDGSRVYYTKDEPKTIIEITEYEGEDAENTCGDRRTGCREDTP